MITISWWAEVLIYMMIYWPLTLLAAISVVIMAFMMTNDRGWRVFWCCVSALIASPLLLFVVIL